MNIANDEITATRITVIVLHDFAHEDSPMHASVTWYQYVTSQDTESALSKRLKPDRFDKWQAFTRERGNDIPDNRGAISLGFVSMHRDNEDAGMCRQ
jgi:hypothetical protein